MKHFKDIARHCIGERKNNKEGAWSMTSATVCTDKREEGGDREERKEDAQ